VDVTEKILLCPLNGWPEDRQLKQVGKVMLVDMVEGVRGVGWKMLALAGMKPHEIEDLIARLQRDLPDEKNRWYFNVCVVYGRKPRPEEIGVSALS
jgi:hypothetical protein